MNAWIIRPGPVKEGKILWTVSLRCNPVHPGNLLLILKPEHLPKQTKNITAAAGALVNPTRQEYKKGMTSRKYKNRPFFR
jgi:hypothetical protein